MKRICFSILLMIVIKFSAIAQLSEERKLQPFDKVRITNEINVYLTKGDSELAKVVVSGIAPEDVLTEINAKTLEITLKRGVYKDARIEIYLTYVELRDLFVSSSGRAAIQSKITGDKVVFGVTANGQIDADVDLRTVDISATNGGIIRLKGKLGSYDASISTGANLSALDLVADSAFVKVSSKGIAKVSAKQLIDADVRTGATLTLNGTPLEKKIKTGIGATVLEQ